MKRFILKISCCFAFFIPVSTWIVALHFQRVLDALISNPLFNVAWPSFFWGKIRYKNWFLLFLAIVWDLRINLNKSTTLHLTSLSFQICLTGQRKNIEKASKLKQSFPIQFFRLIFLIEKGREGLFSKGKTDFQF